MHGEMLGWFLWGNQKGRDHLEGRGVDSRITFKWIFKGILWAGFVWVRTETSVELLCTENEPLGCVKCRGYTA